MQRDLMRNITPHGVKQSDDSFIFDAIATNNESPEYVLSGILAGLYYLPPEKLLASQSGWGRKVRYSAGYRSIRPEWKSVVCPPDLRQYAEAFSSIEYADIYRGIHPMDIDSHGRDDIDGGDMDMKPPTLIGSFRIYKLRVETSRRVTLNDRLASSAIEGSTSQAGISVSNAGGFHGKPNYFDAPEDNDDGAVKMLSEMVNFAVNVAEHHDFTQSSRLGKLARSYRADTDSSTGKTDEALRFGCNTNNALRQLEPAHKAEAWVNINQHGHWNRLHTHEGAAWSGVYYVHSPRQCADRSYGGRLLLKPTPHISENTYRLTPVELARLNCFSLEDRDNSSQQLEFSVTNNQHHQQTNQPQQAYASSDSDAANGTDVERIRASDNDDDLRAIRGGSSHSRSRSDNRNHPGAHARSSGCPDPLPSTTCCDYVEISPDEGTMIIFPSWLHHGVLPLSIREEFRGKVGGLRISLAFNFNEEKEKEKKPSPMPSTIILKGRENEEKEKGKGTPLGSGSYQYSCNSSGTGKEGQLGGDDKNFDADDEDAWLKLINQTAVSGAYPV